MVWWFICSKIRWKQCNCDHCWGNDWFASMVGLENYLNFYSSADGTIDIENAVNARGTVYLTIGEENIGQVQVNVAELCELTGTFFQ